MNSVLDTLKIGGLPVEKLFLTSRIFHNTNETLDYARNHHYAGVEWYLNKTRLMLNPNKIENFFRALNQYPELQFSFHLPTTDVEIGHKNQFFAETSLHYLMMYVDFLKPCLTTWKYKPAFTMHIGANSLPMSLLNWETCKVHLKKLGQHVSQANGCLCLENVKMGWTAEPRNLVDLVQSTQVNITFDTGHAASSPLVRKGKLSLVEYMDQLKPYIRYIHLYGYETLDEGRHLPPKTWSEIKDVWNAIKTMREVQGITLELTTLDELEDTFILLKKYCIIK